MNNLNEVRPTELQAGHAPLPLPHFDEEATMLSARPVVPIQVAEASKHRRSYVVQAAIVLAAALLGAAIALSVDFFQKRQATTTTAVAEPAEVSTEPAARSSQDTASQILDTSEPGSPTSEEPIVPAPTTKAPPIAPRTELNAGLRIKTEKMPSKNSDKDIDREGERAANRRRVMDEPPDEPDEVDQRPRTVRPRRSRQADQIAERPRDASRIREIFEGPRPF